MASGKPHGSVPLFNSSELDSAHQCATLLWHGIHFETGDEIYSDEEFLTWFSTPIQKHLSSKNVPVYFHTHDISNLNSTAKTQMERLGKSLSFPQLETYLTGTLAKIFNDISKSKSQSIQWEISAGYIKHCGKQLVDIKSGISDGYRIPLASRIMFFATPTLPIANFSQALASEFNLQYRSQAALAPFYQIFSNGLAKNANLLSAYALPKSNGKLDDAIYNAVAKSDWWQRRVLDIALLIKFQLATPTSPLPTVPPTANSKSTP